MYEIIILYKNFINFLLSYFYLFIYIELKKKNILQEHLYCFNIIYFCNVSTNFSNFQFYNQKFHSKYD